MCFLIEDYSKLNYLQILFINIAQIKKMIDSNYSPFIYMGENLF
ncbi:hypothetical protein FHS70_005698 [Flammeovirga yaeyamensis]|nr:hypothetical protein [Flammeovirga yaeyamensis]